jgi:hypothetical protein
LLRGVKKIFSPPPEAAFGSPADNSLPRVVDADNAFFYIFSPPRFFTFFADITLRKVLTTKHSFKNNCPYGALTTDRILP